jgi:hypothetical protein
MNKATQTSITGRQDIPTEMQVILGWGNQPIDQETCPDGR